MGVFKLGKMTFGSLFKKPETVLYPFQTKEQPAGLKGHVEIKPEACILCGMCERSCTTNCIRVDKNGRIWSIDRFQCVQCGYCITVCPKKCLAMNPNYAPASTQRASDAVPIPEQSKPASAKKAPESDDAKERVAKSTGHAPAEAAAETRRDEALEAKIALMDAESAQKVREALAARA